MESCIGGYCYRKCHTSDDCPNNFKCHSSHCVLICERNEECLGHQRCLLDSGICTGKTQPETELEIGKGETKEKQKHCPPTLYTSEPFLAIPSTNLLQT